MPCLFRPFLSALKFSVKLGISSRDFHASTFCDKRLRAYRAELKKGNFFLHRICDIEVIHSLQDNKKPEADPRASYGFNRVKVSFQVDAKLTLRPQCHDTETCMRVTPFLPSGW